VKRKVTVPEGRAGPLPLRLMSFDMPAMGHLKSSHRNNAGSRVT
jgi:hypothetical protein